MNFDDHIKLLTTFFGLVIIAIFMESFKLSKQTKYKILVLSIYLVIFEPIEKLHISYYNLNEMVLQILAINLLIYHKVGLKGSIYNLLVSFIFLTMISSFINNETYYWFRYFLNPLLIFVSIKYLATSEKHFWELIRTSRNSLLFYSFLYGVSYKFGSINLSKTFGQYNAWSASETSLLGFGSRTVTFQGFVFDLSSNQIASFIAILLIISFIFYLYSKDGIFVKTLNILLILSGFGIIILTSGRGVFIATSTVFLLILILTLKRNKLNIFILIILFIGIVSLYGNELINQFTGVQDQRWAEMFSDGINSGTSLYRINFLSSTLENSFTNFFGFGYNYYYLRGIDDAMLYSYIINGSGIVSFIIFIIWTVYYIKFMAKGIRHNLPNKAILILGLAVLINVLIAGYSQTYLFGWRPYNIIVWTLLATGYNYYIYQNKKMKAISALHKSKII